MMKIRRLPSIERLRSMFIFDAHTGSFSRATPIYGNCKKDGSVTYKSSKGYLLLSVDGERYLAHRVAWLLAYGEDPGQMEIDHIDRNKTNNSIANLRLASRKQNNENIGVPRTSTSGVRGVSFNSDERKWTAYVYNHRRKMHLGYFVDFEAAVAARKAAEPRFYTGITPADAKEGE